MNLREFWFEVRLIIARILLTPLAFLMKYWHNRDRGFSVKESLERAWWGY